MEEDGDLKNNKLRPWKTLKRELVLDHGRFLQVENHTVQLPDGEVIPDWAWVTVPDAVIVLARTADGEFVCFQQTKYAVEGDTLAPVGGMIEPGEDPLEAAQRELQEETGYQAKVWKPLGAYLLDPNRRMATMHLYLALDAEQVAEPDSDDLEDQELLLLDLETLRKALLGGEFRVAAWAAVVALALLVLET